MKQMMLGIIVKQKNANAERQSKNEPPPVAESEPVENRKPRKRWNAPPAPHEPAKLVLEPDTASRLDNEREKRERKKPPVRRLPKPAPRRGAHDQPPQQPPKLQVVGVGVCGDARCDESFKSHYLRNANGHVVRRPKFRL